MSILHSTVQAALGISISTVMQTVFGTLVAIALLVLFKPLLLGIARALVLVVKPRLNKEERQARRQMRDAKMLNRMLYSMDGSASSHAAELRALAGHS